MAWHETRMDTLVQERLNDPWHNGVAISVYDEATGREVQAGGGVLDPRTPYFATGTTKLYVTAILMQLKGEGKIDLDKPFKTYMPTCKLCVEIHVKDNIDYTDDITIRHLMSHTSGLGDFFIYKHHARALQHAIADGKDEAWTFDDVITRTRSHGAVMEPGVSRRALYTDTNFQILGKVIECIEGKSFAEVFQERISERIGLHSTYIYCDPSDKRPARLMSRDSAVDVPLAMASFQSDGGVVTTSRDALTFTRAFFEGYLFDKRDLRSLFDWRPMFYPTEFGVGLMRAKIPYYMTLRERLRQPHKLFRGVPALYGHVGMGGTFAFYAPEAHVYVAGTVNQLIDPARAVTLALLSIEAMVDGRKKTSPSTVANTVAP